MKERIGEQGRFPQDAVLEPGQYLVHAFPEVIVGRLIVQGL